MNKLLKDAIADAKAVRETALAQAKLALEEAFAPKLQSMLSTKIKEEMDDMSGEKENLDQESMRMKELAGLSEEGDDEMSDDDMGDDMGDDMDDSGDDLEFSIGGQEYEIEPMGGEEGDEDFEDSGDEDMGDDDLEEILRQLEEEEKEEEDESMTMEVSDESVPRPDRNKANYGQEEMEEEINLDELIQALREGDDEEDEKEKMDEVEGDEDYSKAGDQAMNTSKANHGDADIAGLPDGGSAPAGKYKQMQEELNEAYTAVKYLREKLSEVNLLNAKLLYVNKLFRKNGLSEAQKVKIIETFDRAKNVREAKLIFATLAESFTATKTRKPVVENFASAPVKKTKVITEGNQQMNRFKQLAGIIKS